MDGMLAAVLLISYNLNRPPAEIQRPVHLQHIPQKATTSRDRLLDRVAFYSCLLPPECCHYQLLIPILLRRIKIASATSIIPFEGALTFPVMVVRTCAVLLLSAGDVMISSGKAWSRVIVRMSAVWFPALSVAIAQRTLNRPS